MSYTTIARAAAIDWKQTCSTLPDAARAPGPYRGGGPYPFCLPEEYRAYNLLPDARSSGISRFAAARIPWHNGPAGLPCTHLLSSQVQCVNALAPMVRDAEALKQAFGDTLGIATVLPFGDQAFDPDDLVVFEWIGLADHLGEWGSKKPTRGANVTSADAAIRYESSAGNVEVALIEWKYTEQYHGKRLDATKTEKTRIPRYKAAFESGSIRTDLIPYQLLFVEPLYQLMRLQLLARAMEQSHELGASKVRVLYAAPANNRELASSLLPIHQETTEQDHLIEVWRSMIRDEFADRFVYFDTAALVSDGAVTETEFRSRYGHIGATGQSSQK